MLAILTHDRRQDDGVVVAVPVRLPCGGRRRRLSFGTGRLGLLTAVCYCAAVERQASRRSRYPSEPHPEGSSSRSEGDRLGGRGGRAVPPLLWRPPSLAADGSRRAALRPRSSP